MNREIKFRAWDASGQYFKPLEDEGDYYFRDDDNGLCLYDKWGKCKNTILMQYTGLKDKNGKEIYEGDIVRSPHFIDVHKRQHYLFHEVKWDVKYHLWKTVAIGNKEGESINAHGNPPLWIYFKNEQNAEVIGNIYEHPHLLNNEQEDERSVATKMPNEQNAENNNP